MTKKHPWPVISLIVILLIGALLRFLRLGGTSFWLDEAGVAYAAQAATLADMLQVVRSHVMAMPLDYLLVWLVGHISTQEAVLRLPAALWGIFSLLMVYQLYKRMASLSVALFAMLILAISPLHIQYSQELRFYSSLVFFYLLATLLLWQAIEQPTLSRWLLFTAGVILGVYFHPYVLLAFANGLVWIALRAPDSLKQRSLRMGYTFSITLSLLAFLVGYMTFSASNFFKIPLMEFEESGVAAVAVGLGWLPFSSSDPSLAWAWGVVCAALEITGVILVIQCHPRSPLAGIFYSVLIQIGLIFSSDLMEHYFFSPRQLLMLLPLLCLFAGIGVKSLVDAIVRQIQKWKSSTADVTIHSLATGIVVFLLMLASLPALNLYYQDDKGDTRTIIQILNQEWHPGDTTLVTPAFDGYVYKYYLEYDSQRMDISERLFAAAWDELQVTRTLTGSVFLISPQRLSPQEADDLRSLGFSPRYSTQPNSRYAKTLWVAHPAAP